MPTNLWQPGESGNPAGRLRGSRNRLSEAVICALLRDFEKHAMTQAYAVPFLWWNRIVATSSRLKGWAITPSHYINQQLDTVWLAE